jgi:rhodanese-related sulfurtransferase
MNVHCTILQKSRHLGPLPDASISHLLRRVSEIRTIEPSPCPPHTVVGMTYAGDLTPTEAWELLHREPEAALVDVRSEPEWMFVGVPHIADLGKKLVTVSWNHWPGGRNSTFLEDLAAAGVTGGPVLFICRSGARSRAAAIAATQAGIAPAYNVSEGFEGDLDEHGHRGVNGWRSRGLPWRQS